MGKRENVVMICSSAAEYLTFVVSTGDRLKISKYDTKTRISD